MRDLTQPPPGIKRSVIQLKCEKCGRETHANCDCGVSYKPIEVAKEYVDNHPSASIRKIQQETGVSFPTAQRAKAGVSPDTPTIGRDNKTYPATKPRENPMQTEQTAIVDEGKIVNHLATEIIKEGYETLRERFQYDKPTMTRLARARDNLRNNVIEW